MADEWDQIIVNWSTNESNAEATDEKKSKTGAAKAKARGKKDPTAADAEYENGQEEEDEEDSPDGDQQGEGADKDSQMKPSPTNSVKKLLEEEEKNVNMLPFRSCKQYDTLAALHRLEEHPLLKIRREGKYYMKLRDVVTERHPKVKRRKNGSVILTIKKETMGPIEKVISRFCEEVLCISRSTFLPLSSQGERHLIWVGKKTANHIIRRLNGNGCYMVNRFPGDIFVKDKQVMGVTMRQNILMISNVCPNKCGEKKVDFFSRDKKEPEGITGKLCPHLVKNMTAKGVKCEDKACFNAAKAGCSHFDVFIPEVQSFCTYNALQAFSNRFDHDLKGQTFICKPAYLYKGLGFRFFRKTNEFQEFYHMTEGKETSRHDFMVQRMVDRPASHNGRKFDIRSFLLVIVLRYRRVISFVHYGFCRLASARLEEQEEEAKEEETPTDKEIELRKAKELENDMQMYVCTYMSKSDKRKRKDMFSKRQLYTPDDDRSVELSAIYTEKEDRKAIEQQINHIAFKVTKAIENKVWEWFGCFQIFSLDMCPTDDKKLWLIEVNSHAISQVDTLSPTQRKVVPAMLMESIGLVVETIYKSYRHLRLRKDPENEFKETGFLFLQNYQYIFSTKAKMRMDYVWPKPPRKKQPPFFERIGVVDHQMKEVKWRKSACDKMKADVDEERQKLKEKRDAKNENES